MRRVGLAAKRRRDAQESHTGAPVSMSAVQDGGGRRTAKLKLAVGSIGIVFGDIGTSPIYAFRETFVGPHKLAIDDAHILGVVSLIFWSMTIVVSLQYVTILLRADNKGEGGTLALVAMLGRHISRLKSNWLTELLAVAAPSLSDPGAAASPSPRPRRSRTCGPAAGCSCIPSPRAR